MMSSLLFKVKNVFSKRGNVYLKSQFDDRDRILTIVFSSIPQKPMLHSFEGSCIRVYEDSVSQKWLKGTRKSNTASGGWFFGNVTQTMRVLSAEIDKRHWRKIVFLGSSKSGFAALLYAHFFAIKYPTKKVGCVAYSPATFLQSSRQFEHDHGPSLAQMRSAGFLKDIFERYGDLAILLEDSPIHKALLVYSKGFEDDFVDFKRMRPLSFAKGVEVISSEMEKVKLHPHLTLEFMWRHNRKRFYELINESVA